MTLAERLQDALGGAYRVERELPLGGLGRLFHATAAGERPVVVHVLPPDIASRLDTARFVAEVERISRLRHPNLQPVLAAGSSEDLVWCVAQRSSGESVRFRLQRDGGLGPGEVVQVLHDVADALAFAHAHGAGHGDLRPDNIYLLGERATLTEFGLRSALAVALEGESRPDEAADVHSLAVAGNQMLGGVGSPVAATLARALSIDPGERFATAAEFRDAVGTPPSARRLRARRRVVALVLLFGLVAGTAIVRMRSAQPLDHNVIVVAPFEVLEPDHALWREGLVTVLSANLDGAGPLRTVSPALAVRSWGGGAGIQAAAALGQRTGAGLAVFGRVLRVGRDSVRVTATLVDAGARQSLGEVQLSDHETRIDQLTDALTVAILDRLGRTRPIGAVRRASLGSASLPAIKEYLLGEQHYRRSEWDSAIVRYQNAIELDPAFALPLYRAGIVLGWQSSSSDSLSRSYLRRAAALNRGLPPRESLLVTAESLSAALEEGPGNPDYWRHYRRLYATVDAASRLYPRDAEVWYAGGEMRYHYPEFTTVRETRVSFDQSILLDSAFAPAYIHSVELALQAGDRAGARRYVDAYLRHGPRDTYADAMRLTRELLDPRRARSHEVTTALDTASADLLVAILPAFRGWPDTLRTAIRLVRLLRAGRPARVRLYGDTTEFVIPELASQLIYNGMVAEAWNLLGQQPTGLYAVLAWAGGVPDDSARALFGRALRGESGLPFGMAVNGAPWWLRRGDAVSLRALAARARALGQGRNVEARDRLRYAFVSDGATAFAAFVEGDTAAALAGLMALADTACATCTLWWFARAAVLEAARADSLAARVLEREPPGFVYPLDPHWMLYRARVAQRRGDRATAQAAYRYVRDAWLDADPPFQPIVREAEAALAIRSRRR
jgi:tRNA A-37 threonylcarbamoyl transferase component Bud32/tetratricopeptide (TPR) repeat protein